MSYTVFLTDATPIQHLTFEKLNLWDWTPIGHYPDSQNAKEAIIAQGYMPMPDWAPTTRRFIGGKMTDTIVTFLFDPAIKGTRLSLICPTDWLIEMEQS